mgnify:CR=1 FL=1
MADLAQIADDLSSLTVIEAAELSKMLEEKWGVSAAAPVAVAAAGAAPANFLDVGGGATPEKVASAVKIILSDAKVRRVLVNIFGGILRCDIAGEGIVLAYKETGSKIPLVVRMLGTNVVEGKEILSASGLPVTFADTLTEAAQAIKNLDV